MKFHYQQTIFKLWKAPRELYMIAIVTSSFTIYTTIAGDAQNPMGNVNI